MAAAVCCGAADLDEVRVKREQVFAFARKPAVTREGDRVTVTFETKGFCDVTVAVEDAKGQIVRHVVSGVLGPNAPAPFIPNAKRQTIVWDGKNDQGVYIDDKDSLSVRVSLGLKPRFERALHWDPRRRMSGEAPLIQATKEGVFVYDARGCDRLRVYDHDGDYLRTVYPFPAGKVGQVKGLVWKTWPRDGKRLPVKRGAYQNTFLTSGTPSMEGVAAVAMAARDGRIALVNRRLNRLATDGTTGGRPLEGPTVPTFRASVPRKDTPPIRPWSAALSPDGKWLYLSLYAHRYGPGLSGKFWNCRHGVMRMPFEGDGKAAVFAGKMGRTERGAGDGAFHCAAGVACDAEGRVYVADFMNDRVQVFAADGRHLKNIPAEKPATVQVHPETGDVYVFSWMVNNPKFYHIGRDVFITPSVTHFGPFDNPVKKARYELPLRPQRNTTWKSHADGPMLTTELDFWADEPTVWVGRQGGQGGGHYAGRKERAWERGGILLIALRDGKAVVKRDFGKELTRFAGTGHVPRWNMQRMAVNPKTGILHVFEVDTFKGFTFFIKVDPETGRVRRQELPWSAEDAAFDINGLVYLRQTGAVGRFNPKTWEEVPWDYGVEIPSLGGAGKYGKNGPLKAGLLLPSQSPVCYHQGGLSISPTGRLAVSCAFRKAASKRMDRKATLDHQGTAYTPTMYPGRLFSSTGACVHVWDERGRLVYEDAVKGMPQIDGLGIDRDDSLYIMATAARAQDGRALFEKGSETIVKLDPRRAKFITGSPRTKIPLPRSAWPDRPRDLGGFWVEGAKWFFGGVGFAGFPAAGCACWHVRFAHDYFARSFAPELDRYQVAVVDSAGNLILRIGQYGNEDDGLPLVKRGGPPNPTSVGGDEVALMHPCYLATHTDRRLFVADFGNSRIVSVRLDYHTTNRVRLKDVKESS